MGRELKPGVETTTLGQSGPLTGLQLFTKVNCALLAIGGAPVTTPPAKPLLSPLPIDTLDITNAAGVITIRLHTTDSPPDGTMLRACAPQNSGCRRGVGYRLLGTLDSPVNNYVIITTAYTNRFGVPAVDACFRGSSFAPEASFRLDAAVVPPSGPVPGNANHDGVVSQAELDAVLAAYWPTSPWLYIINAAGLGETNVTFALTNSIAGAYSVWMSTNLADWDYLGPAIPRYEFTDTNAPAVPQRYYRLSYP